MPTIIQTVLSVVTTAILVGMWARITRTWALVNKRDQILEEVKVSLDALKSDNQCQYMALLASFEAQELQLHALKGKKMNGNVDDALEKIARAKDELQRRIVGQACK